MKLFSLRPNGSCSSLGLKATYQSPCSLFTVVGSPQPTQTGSLVLLVETSKAGEPCSGESFGTGTISRATLARGMYSARVTSKSAQPGITESPTAIGPEMNPLEDFAA